MIDEGGFEKARPSIREYEEANQGVEKREEMQEVSHPRLRKQEGTRFKIP